MTISTPIPMISTAGQVYVPQSPESPTPSRVGRLTHDLSLARERTKNWCWTTNNYTALDLINLTTFCENPEVSYIIYGKEVGDSGTPHLQGFVQFKKRKDFNWVRDRLPFGSHLERALGSPYQAAEYCRKEDPNPMEFVNLA